MEVLPYFGATPTDERVVVDGKLITAGGVTSGIDGSLVIVSLLRGESVAHELQLYMAYDPQPPFQAGSPASAPASILKAVTQRAKAITEQRLETARAYQKVKQNISK
jgi:cyclohexyl-isocyanide hydratase